MAEEEKQEGQKTVVSFVVGLLIGGLLVWAFSSPEDTNSKVANTDKSDKKEQVSNKEVVDEDVEENEDEEVEKVVVPKEDTASKSPTLPVGNGKITVNDQPAGSHIEMVSATYPVSEGWVGVRSYEDGQVGRILGVMRFSEEQGLVPDGITLVTPTVAGQTYAIVVFKEDGDRSFDLTKDIQLETVFDTFVAN